MQTALRLIYPAQCLTCSEMVEADFALCGSCWGKTHFIRELTCCRCGVPLQGDPGDDEATCDDCIAIARPWSRGAAALLYKGNGRKLVMALKHGDRTELARPAAAWMQSVMPEQPADVLVVPAPLHWMRFLKRRYNQAALLARELALLAGLDYRPDALIRPSRTKPLDGHTREARFKALQNAIQPNPKHASRLEGRHILLVDDVMTSGATLASCTEACMQAGADHVDVLTLARVAKDV